MTRPVVQSVEHLLHTVGVGHRSETVACRRPDHAAAGQQLILVDHGRTADGVTDKFEITVLQWRWNPGCQICCLCRQGAPPGHPLLDLRFGIVDEPHMGIFAGSLQLIVASHQVGYLLRRLCAKSLCRPVLDIVVCFCRFPAVDVPGQVHHERYLLLGRLDVADVEDPYLPCTVGVGLGEFCAEERRRQRTEPDPTGGVAVVGEVVVDAGAAFPFLLFGVGQVSAVAVLVIAPEQGDVVGHLQAVVVGVEHLLIGTEHLRNLLDRFLDIPSQHVALVIDGLLHQSDALLGGVGTFHRIVVDAAQTEGVGVLVSAVGLGTCFPVALHRGAVGDIVEVTPRTGCPLLHCLPLTLVVTQHLLTV